LHKSQIDCNKITQVHIKQVGPGVGVFVKRENPTPGQNPDYGGLRLHTFNEYCMQP